MKNLILALIIGLALFLVSPSAVFAEDALFTEPYAGIPVCLPDVHLESPSSCLPLGPSQTLTDLARKGLAYPPRPLPAVKPTAELAKSPVWVAKIKLDPALPVLVYATLDDAVAGVNSVRTIAPGNGLRYVSYIQEVRVNGKPYVMIKTGE